MFQIGDRVKCISKASNQPLIIGREYIIYNIKNCIECGHITLDVGLVGEQGFQFCIKCNNKYNSPIIWWFSEKRFVKVQEKKEYIAVQSNVEVKEEDLQLN